MRSIEFIAEVKARYEMTDLDPWTFDQTPAGWRGLPSSARQADAIRQYIETYVKDGRFVGAPEGAKTLRPYILYWHLGQVLTQMGRNGMAVGVMRRALDDGEPGWNAYVMATISFLRKDRRDFDHWAPLARGNEETIQRLTAGWGLPYKQAYAGQKAVTEDSFQGIDISMERDDDEIMVRASAGGKQLGSVLFVEYDGYLMPQDLEVDERFRGQGIAQAMYDYVKSLGYRIRRSGQQTDAGAGFWGKHRPDQNVWEQGIEENFADGKVKEMAPPPISVKSATLYHGTPTLNNAQGIIRNGLKFDPELIAQKYQGSENFAPLPGVYLSKDFGNAVRYSFMSQVPDEQYAEYIKQEPYGYVFEFLGQSLSQTSPDEDELGRLLEKFVKTKNLPPKLSALIQGIPENLKSQLSQPDVSFETIAVAGKWLVSKLKPQTLQYLMQKYINVVNYGIMKPVAVWKIPKPEQRFLRDRQGTFDTLNGYINWANRYGKKQPLEENFADGKVKGRSRPGRVKRSGASCAGSVTDLRARAKKYGGERGKMYHWCANMKSGRKK